MGKDKDIEELDKTTDLLKTFKPRISEEEYTEDIESLLSEWNKVKKEEKNSKKNEVDFKEFESAPLSSQKVKQARKNLEYVDDKTLELSDLELDKTIKLDKTMNFNNLSDEETQKIIEEAIRKTREEEDRVIVEKLTNDLPRKIKQKKYALLIAMIGLFFIPLLITLHIIHTHSNLLITDTIDNIIIFILGVCIGLLVIGVIFYLKNYRINKPNGTMSLKKYIYCCVLVFYSVCCITGLVLLYGPSNEFKDWLVTTAMATKDHQYYCEWFYSKKEIDEVFTRNYIKETGESTNEDLIDVNTNTNSDVYANKYEEQILKKENEDDIYKVITFEVNGCKAYLAVIYDPSKVRVTTTKNIGVRGEYVVDMAKRENASVAINGSGFYDPGYNSTGGCPKGITIVNGKVVTNNEYGKASTGGLIGLTKDNKLVLLKNVTANQALQKGVRDAVSWGPFLIVNGKAAYTSGNGGWGYAARTAIGQRKDGIILLLVVDSNYNRTKGADMVTLTKIMQNYGAINAANLDGGTSSVMVLNGKMISQPIDGALNKQTRPIATSIIVDK